MPDATHPTLGDITIDDPCDEPWDAMEGDDARRFCDRCGEHVYNTAGLTDEELAPVVADRSKCLRLTVDRRGGLVTRSRRLAVLAAAALCATPATAAAQKPPLYERPPEHVLERARKQAARNRVEMTIEVVRKPSELDLEGTQLDLGEPPTVVAGVRRPLTSGLIGRRGN